MASIGKIVASAASVQLENTNALAQLNFDFSLVRVEAPPEFRALGASLSKSRVHEAENGKCHVTARKLAALFKDVIPSTPNLVSAYGTRASQIIESPKHNPKVDRHSGLLVDHIGADGTSIWAAATSGKAAIAVHLLACMLARIWSGPEATSIWVEIVKERKCILSELDEDGMINVAAATASQIDISRDQLANWDASARAWLQIADSAMELKQKQLSLIIDNLGLPISQINIVYQSVVSTWKAALETVERLISGAPQSIHYAAPLLGLSAWHIYPDMLYIGHSSIHIKQDDTLVAKGGLLTLGISHASPSHNGIYWSLPLSHLYCYGDPYVASGVFALNSSRVTVDQFSLVMLGSLIQLWKNMTPGLLSFEKAATIIALLYKGLGPDDSSSWLFVLGSASKNYLTSINKHKNECLQLIKLGARRFADYLRYHTMAINPLFGLCNVMSMLRFIGQTENQVQFLRDWVGLNESLSGKVLVIQYKRTLTDEGRIFSYLDTVYEFASVSPKERESRLKRKHDVFEDSNEESIITEEEIVDSTFQFQEDLKDARPTKSTRWIAGLCSEENGFSEEDVQRRHDELQAIGEDVRVMKKLSKIQRLPERPRLMHGTNRHEDISMFEEALFATSHDSFRDLNTGEHAPNTHGRSPVKRHLRDDNYETESHLVKFTEILNYFDDVVLYAIEPIDYDDEPLTFENKPLEISSDQMIHLVEKWLSKGCIDATYILHYFSMPKMDERPQAYPSNDWFILKVLATVVSVFRKLDAKINLPRLKSVLCQSNWLPQEGLGEPVLGPLTLDLAQTFACICMFDSSAAFDFAPNVLRDVMAVANENSIFLSTSLIQDPSCTSPDQLITRVIGNLGRPGMTLLVSPANPRVKKLSEGTWDQINHYSFDGKGEDNFQGSSLHLNLLAWESVADISMRGLLDQPARFQEAAVSLIDKGSWVADLNIRQAEKFYGKEILFVQPCELHDPQEQSFRIYNGEVETIDNWNELLDPPLQDGIIRAKGNWEARLAAVTLSSQLHYSTVVLPADVCWSCVMTMKRVWRMSFAQEPPEKVDCSQSQSIRTFSDFPTGSFPDVEGQVIEPSSAPEMEDSPTEIFDEDRIGPDGYPRTIFIW